MTSRPLVSREYVYVAEDNAANVETNRAVTRKRAKHEEGRFITSLGVMGTHFGTPSMMDSGLVVGMTAVRRKPAAS